MLVEYRGLRLSFCTPASRGVDAGACGAESRLDYQ